MSSNTPAQDAPAAPPPNTPSPAQAQSAPVTESSPQSGLSPKSTNPSSDLSASAVPFRRRGNAADPSESERPTPATTAPAAADSKTAKTAGPSTAGLPLPENPPPIPRPNRKFMTVEMPNRLVQEIPVTPAGLDQAVWIHAYQFHNGDYNQAYFDKNVRPLCGPGPRLGPNLPISTRYDFDSQQKMEAIENNLKLVRMDGLANQKRLEAYLGPQIEGDGKGVGLKASQSEVNYLKQQMQQMANRVSELENRVQILTNQNERLRTEHNLAVGALETFNQDIQSQFCKSADHEWALSNLVPRVYNQSTLQSLVDGNPNPRMSAEASPLPLRQITRSQQPPAPATATQSVPTGPVAAWGQFSTSSANHHAAQVVQQNQQANQPRRGGGGGVLGPQHGVQRPQSARAGGNQGAGGYRPTINNSPNRGENTRG